MSTENSLQYIYETMNLDLPKQEVDLMTYSDAGKLFEHEASERIGAALRVFLKSVVESSSTIDKIDRAASYGERWSDHAPVVVDYTA